MSELLINRALIKIQKIPRRSCQTWPEDAGTRHRRRRPGAGCGAGSVVVRGRDSAPHGAQASQPSRACAGAAARGNIERLQGYDLCRYEAGDRDEAHGFIRKWRLKCKSVADSLEEAGDKFFTFTHFPKSQWKTIRTSNAIERLHEEFKRRVKTQTVLPSAETAAMLFWALLASGQITMRKVDGWQSLAEKPSDQIIDLAA